MTTTHPYVDLAEWRRSPRSGVALRKECAHLDTETEDDGARVVRFVMTSDEVDRENDILAADGWDFTEFKKNSVALWAHDARSLPIGKVFAIRRVGGRHEGSIEFAPASLNPFADQVYRMVKAGYLNAVSVGFLPEEWTYDERRGGVNFRRQSLLELSVVPVPALASALVVERGANVNGLNEWLKRSRGERPDDDYVVIEGCRMRAADFARAIAHSVRTAVGEAMMAVTGKIPDTPVLRLHVPDNTVYRLDPDKLRETVRTVVPEIIKEAIKASMREQLTALTGRID